MVTTQSVAEVNQLMWQKYRHELMHTLSRHYCSIHGQGFPCSVLDKTVFQFVDEPRDAAWHESRTYVCFFDHEKIFYHLQNS